MGIKKQASLNKNELDLQEEKKKKEELLLEEKKKEEPQEPLLKQKKPIEEKKQVLVEKNSLVDFQIKNFSDVDKIVDELIKPKLFFSEDVVIEKEEKDVEKKENNTILKLHPFLPKNPCYLMLKKFENKLTQCMDIGTLEKYVVLLEGFNKKANAKAKEKELLKKQELLLKEEQ